MTALRLASDIGNWLAFGYPFPIALVKLQLSRKALGNSDLSEVADDSGEHIIRYWIRGIWAWL